MRAMLSFTCRELDLTYDEIYRELAIFLEQSPEEVCRKVSPDDATVLLKYHRRQAQRRRVFTDLADQLGVDAMTVFSAVSADGAMILLEALNAKRIAEAVNSAH